VAQVLVTPRECIKDLASLYDNLELIRISQAVPAADPPSGQGSRPSGLRIAGLAPRYVPENPLQQRQWAFPYHTVFHVNAVRFSLTYERPVVDAGNPTRAMFTAFMPSPSEAVSTPVVAKYTRRHSAEAHRLLAEMSLAPKLLYHEHIAGIHFVFMEHLEVTEVTGNLTSEEGATRRVHSLRRAIRALHDRKLVFGDLREPNILITKDGLKLVGFD